MGKYISLFILLSAVYANAATLVEQNLDYGDHRQNISNPGRGIASHKGFRLHPGKLVNLRQGIVYSDFMRFQVDLGPFSDNAIIAIDKSKSPADTTFGKTAPLDSFAIESLHSVLDSLRKRNGFCVIRVSYDMNCYGHQDPPLETIFTHTKQIAKAYKGYEDVIHFVELGMFGTCGEQTGGGTNEEHGQALRIFLENSSPEIRVGMRNPYAVAAWMGLKDSTKQGWPTFPDFNIHSARFQDSANARSKYMKRVGIYNDGYLGSDNDLGTVGWGTDPISREEFLEWLESGDSPYGGDFVHNYNDPEKRPPLNTAEYMSYEGFRTHTSYLNGFGNFDKYYHNMDTALFKGLDPEYAMRATAYEYIRDHLGYRFVLRSSQIVDSVGNGGTLAIRVKIQNVGFGKNLMVEKSSLILKSQGKDGTILELPLDFSPTTLRSPKFKTKVENPTATWNGSNLSDLIEETPEFDGTSEIEFSPRLPKDIPYGEWKVFLRFSHFGNFRTDKNYHVIRFANDSSYFDPQTGSNYLGKFILSENILAIPQSSAPEKLDIRTGKNFLRIQGAKSVEIFGIDGKSLLRKNLNFAPAEIPLDLENGIYVIRAQGKSYGKIQKFTVSK